MQGGKQPVPQSARLHGFDRGQGRPRPRRLCRRLRGNLRAGHVHHPRFDRDDRPPDAGRRVFAARGIVPPGRRPAPRPSGRCGGHAGEHAGQDRGPRQRPGRASPPLAITGVTQPGNGAADRQRGRNDHLQAEQQLQHVRPGPGHLHVHGPERQDLSATANVGVTVTQYCPLVPGARFFDTLDPQTAVYSTSSTRSLGGWSVSADPTAHSSSHAWVVLDDQPGVPALTQKDDTLTLPSLGLSSSSVLNFWHNFDLARFAGTPGRTFATRAAASSRSRQTAGRLEGPRPLHHGRRL